MRLNIIAWDITAKIPELVSDYWEPMSYYKDAIKELKQRGENKKTQGERALIIDWSSRKVIAELKGGKVTEYKD